MPEAREAPTDSSALPDGADRPGAGEAERGSSGAAPREAEAVGAPSAPPESGPAASGTDSRPAGETGGATSSSAAGPSGPPPRTPESGERPAAAAGDEEAAGPRGAPVTALTTEDLTVWFMGLLAAKAWEGMGLTADPATGKVQKDLAAARLAIDGYGALLEVVRSRLDEAPRREIETLLTNLRVNFVEKSAGEAR